MSLAWLVGPRTSICSMLTRFLHMTFLHAPQTFPLGSFSYMFTWTHCEFAVEVNSKFLPERISGTPLTGLAVISCSALETAFHRCPGGLVSLPAAPLQVTGERVFLSLATFEIFLSFMGKEVDFLLFILFYLNFVRFSNLWVAILQQFWKIFNHSLQMVSLPHSFLSSPSTSIITSVRCLHLSCLYIPTIVFFPINSE